MAAPTGAARMANVKLVIVVLISFIRFRAAKKLSGTAINVPTVVAMRARNTVSMILSHVSRAVAEIRGEATVVCPPVTGSVFVTVSGLKIDPTLIVVEGLILWGSGSC